MAAACTTALVKRGGEIYYIYRGEFRTPMTTDYNQRATGINHHCDIGTAVLGERPLPTAKVYFERVAYSSSVTERTSYTASRTSVDAGDLCHIPLLHLPQPLGLGAYERPVSERHHLLYLDDLIHWENHGLLFPDAGESIGTLCAAGRR